MPDSLPTIWHAEPHTFAKHRILKVYLEAWAPILSIYLKKINSRKKYLLFVDGFAGPGIYKDGQDGSPVLALNAVLKHTFNLPTPIRFVFIEKDKERFHLLSKRIEDMKNIIDNSERIYNNVEVIRAECEERINKYIDHCQEKNIRLGPAFFFLDQFGYSQVSMLFIKRLMNNKMCEVFSYFHWDGLNRFLGKEEISESVDEVYGGKECREVFQLDYKARSSFMLERYKIALKEKAGVKYVLSFAMKDKTGKLISWLFFSTNNFKGLIKMKEAMWKVGSEGGFYFSDKDDPSQLNIYSSYDNDLLTRDLFLKFIGTIVKVSEIEEFVLTETPAYIFRKLLKKLEDGKRIEVVDPPQNRKRGSFKGPDLLVKFIS